MNGFLSRVVQEKVTELAFNQDQRPMADLRREAAAVPARDFRSAIAGGGIIAEIKRKSPSVAAFRQQGPPEHLATVYANAGAAAISIVTDEPHFGTSLRDVAPVRRAVGLPVLVKDFFVDEYQVVQARAAGADAVLLIARILQDAVLAGLLRCTGELGVCALVECHDEKDVQRAVAAGAQIVGINNRDLETLAVSVETTRRLVDLVPEGVTCVAESGISRREVIAELSTRGVDAFLIGTALLDAVDPGLKLRELHGELPG